MVITCLMGHFIFLTEQHTGIPLLVPPLVNRLMAAESAGPGKAVSKPVWFLQTPGPEVKGVGECVPLCRGKRNAQLGPQKKTGLTNKGADDVLWGPESAGQVGGHFPLASGSLWGSGAHCDILSCPREGPYLRRAGEPVTVSLHAISSRTNRRGLGVADF